MNFFFLALTNTFFCRSSPSVFQRFKLGGYWSEYVRPQPGPIRLDREVSHTDIFGRTVFSARALIKSLRGIIDEPNPGQTQQPTQQQTPTPTTWSTTSTTSTICTATATTTPIIILTKQNINRAQFDGLVESLPKSDENLIVAEPWMDHVCLRIHDS